jgi:hypothetical protein
VLTLTLDHNCLIDFEKQEGESSAVQELIALHRAGLVRVHLGGISASENVRGGGEPTYELLRERIERLGLSDLPDVLPEFRLGMSYIGACVLAGVDDLEKRVRAVVHPSVGDYDQFAVERGLDPCGPMHPRWRNRACDIGAMVAHIRRGHDVFVTRDPDLLKARERLVAMGAGEILKPHEALRKVRPDG